MATGIPLDGLGMDEKAMLELTNRLNKYDDRKWVLTYVEDRNPNIVNPLFGLGEPIGASTNPFMNAGLGSPLGAFH